MSNYLSTASYKGARDFYPDEMRLRNWLFQNISSVVESFGFEKIDAPLIEPVEIYLAKTSEEIVNQQIYSFTDRGDRKVAIRPEMTPTVARMVAAKIRELPRPIRWYSLPNLWRYEKMGKGRLREHWQLNADLLGTADEGLADAEIIQLIIEIFSKLGATAQNYRVYINHRKILDMFFEKILKLDHSHWAAISRIMDKKDKITPDDFRKMLTEAGLSPEQIKNLENYLNSGLDFLKSGDLKNEEPVRHLLSLLENLHSLYDDNIVQYNPSIVRGFDYYTGLVFEVFDLHPENRRALAGGGRYDNLVSAFTRDSINAIGFGVGDVTLMDFLKVHGLLPATGQSSDIYLVVLENHLKTFQLSQKLRQAGFRTELSSAHKKLGKQLDEAHKKKIPFVLIQGQEETAKGVYLLKDMASGLQEEIPENDLLNFIAKKIHRPE